MRPILCSFLALALAACAGDEPAPGAAADPATGVTADPGTGVATDAASGVAAESVDLTVPPEIALPPGQHEVLQAHGFGFQIYECAASSTGGRAWAFRAPAAVLVAADGELVATHFGGVDVGLPAGVYWQSTLDGSRVHGGKALTAPNPGAVPLVRLSALDTTGDGIFTPVTFIHRLATVGGVGPTGECPQLGIRVPVPYQAEYVFYAAALPRPEVPATIEVAAGNDVDRVLHAQGFQVYQCVPDATGALAWAFRAPRADLFNDDGTLEVHHFGGIEADLPPGVYWQSVKDRSRVLAGKAVTSPNPGAIPEVRLQALDTIGAGILSRVSFIQRLDTVGGVGPTGACSPQDAQVPVPYTADYYFYMPNVDGQ